MGFLHRVHRQERVPPPSVPLQFDNNPDFNEYVDEAHEPLRIFEVDYRPSEVLFHVDQEAYRIYLAEYEPEPALEQGAPDEPKTAEATP